MKSRNISLILQDVPELAVPQLVLAMMAIMSFHVQIINRIASGYPTWYLMVATWVVGENSLSGDAALRRRSQWIIRGMALYALVQGILFANFLPPA
jgi:phosphatidylinositol glycan class V